MNIFFWLAGTAVAGWTAWSYFTARSVGQPHYTVVKERPDYEVRSYDPMVVAETDVMGDIDEALSTGFRPLFDYISGDNERRGRIAMTAPVLGRARRVAEKIPMTAPVLESARTEYAGIPGMSAAHPADKGERTVAFVMPAGATLESLPAPRDPKVRLRRVPARTVAALRFTGFATPRQVSRKEHRLLAALLRDGQQVVGEPEFAGYNPPYTIPFLRRNEILVEVAPARE